MASSKAKRKLNACSNCRRLKTRCEVLDLQPPICCHRCRKVGIDCSYSELDASLFLEQEKPKYTGETYLAFARAFQDLQAFSPDYINTHFTWIVSSRNIAVDTLLQRIVEWFEKFNGSKIDNWHELDWSSPLACITSLQSCHSVTSPEDESLFSPQDTVPENILSYIQIYGLLQLYQQKYGGWLSFTVTEETHDSLLCLVCCTLAAQHLPEHVRWRFAPKLQAMTEQMIRRVMSGPTPFPASSTTVKALYLWAAWLPLARNKYEQPVRDRYSVLSAVLDMALRLRLDGCAQRLLEIRELQAAGHPVDMNLAAELLDKARLWAWITIANAEYSLSNGEFPHRSHGRHGPSFASVFPLTHTIPAHLDGCQDARIRIIADLLRVTETALKIKPYSNHFSDLEHWFRERRRCLRDLANLQRASTLFSPLSDLAKHQFTHLGLFSRMLQLRVCYDVLYTAWKLYETSPQYKDNPNNPFWCLEIDPSLVDWMKDGLVLAEEILLWAIQVDSDVLVVLPDHVFLYFSFAATFVIGVKFIGFNALHTAVPSVDCQLLNQAIENVKRAALWPGHPAKFCADFLMGLLSLWDNREFLFTGGDGKNGDVFAEDAVAM
ncbi:hypothetical protein Moror_15751 [Moniliophthora roreri MCA 2997]|uniref:Zn(2)-C6 fungal-type domain-containing protein n=2 Tax=Moniliophthora roreri TaxID=221103 RepID=V2WDU7_MONRO|nr:hypothetical protein Moror_15751 [Moniliophthora roreri MCA 2997]